MSNKLLTVTEVASRLNVTTSRVYTLAREGLLPSVRLGRQLRIDPELLDEFIQSGGKSLPGGWKKEQ